MRRPAHPTRKRRQQGIALMLMLTIMILGVTAVLIGSLGTTALKNLRQEKTAEALSQAKDALIGYAITYRDTHTTSPQVHGYLPCPDNDGGNPEGSAEPTCGTQYVSRIGRIPWRTLNIDALQDGNGECLWYALSGSFKNNPKADFMNWDTVGQLEVADSSGNTLANNVVAVVLSPGSVQPGQSRSTDGTAPVCGGSYTAGNYLDDDAALGINNATPSSTAKATSRFIASGSSQNVNDQLVFITTHDLFDKIKRRNDFSSFVATLLSSASACLSALPAPININFDTAIESAGTSVGSLITGRIPYDACSDNLVRQWRDNLLYAKCVSGSCQVNGTACNSGVLIFAGERGAMQVRLSNSDKNNWNNYLEDSSPSSNILTAFSMGETDFSGAISYTATAPSTDVLACIPIPPP